MRLLATALLGAFLLLAAPWRATAQLQPPTTPPTVASTVPDTTSPPVTAPPATAQTAPPTTARRVTTTTVVATTRTIRDITVPTVEPDPGEIDPVPLGGGGGISPIFSLLSIAGFATFGGILFRQWRTTSIRGENGHSG